MLNRFERHMWAEACDLLRRAERLHSEFFRPVRGAASGIAWEPPVDIFEMEREYAINVALPGVAPSDIRVAIEPGAIIVSCDRPAAVSSNVLTVHRLEIPHGRFERRIALPARARDIGRHEMVNGCLTLWIRKG